MTLGVWALESERIRASAAFAVLHLPSAIGTEKFDYIMANFKLHLAYDALEDLATLSCVNK
jgi:hypothetical protein